MQCSTLVYDSGTHTDAQSCSEDACVCEAVHDSDDVCWPVCRYVVMPSLCSNGLCRRSQRSTYSNDYCEYCCMSFCPSCSNGLCRLSQCERDVRSWSSSDLQIPLLLPVQRVQVWLHARLTHKITHATVGGPLIACGRLPRRARPTGRIQLWHAGIILYLSA